MKNLHKLLIAVVFILVANFSFAANKLTVENPRTNYLINPLGIGTERPLLSWESQSAERNVMQTAYQLRAAYSEGDLKSGKNLIVNTEKVISDQSLQVEYTGPALEFGKRVYWQVKVWDNKGNASAWSKVAFFEPGFMNASNRKASFISPDFSEDYKISNPSPMLRKEFLLKGNIKNARMYASALGIFSIRLNGKVVGNEMFAPGWTSYSKRLQYRVYDITSLLQSGANATGILLGDGWYRGNMAWKRNGYGQELAAYVQIEVTYANGTTETINTDNTWKASTGAILTSDFYNGETYDARLEKNGWDKAGYNDKDWKKTKRNDFDKNLLVASESPSMQVLQIIKPIAKITTPKGETVFDMGQNMVGILNFKLKGKAGEMIKLNFAEVLDRDGNFYTENLRQAKCEDIYYFKGDGLEEYEPLFTFHGFRYVKISDYSGSVNLEDLTGKVIYSAMPEIGNFTCSDSLVNKLQENIRWGLRGNFVDVPTDCPQRDERLGWTGDAQAFAPTACYLQDASTFFSKWLQDLAADQSADGNVPYIVPDMKIGAGAAGWGDVATIVPMVIYDAYGDKKLIERQYPSMKAWTEFLRNKAGNSHLVRYAQPFGDWLAFSTDRSDYPGATTDKDLIATLFFGRSIKLTERAARIIGKTAEADDYAELFKKVKTAFVNEYMTPTGRLSSNTQTAYVLALAFDMVPEELKKSAAERLANNVRSFGHITTGFLGTPLINEVLSDCGYHDVACMLLFRKDYPSWLYPVTKGATTIWERWDGIRPDGSLQDPGMNSYNHYAYGAVGNWLYTRVAGIRMAKEAYKKISINPLPTKGMDFVKADLKSVYGLIESQIAGKTYKITIPVNTTAEIKLPSKSENIKESGKKLADLKDAKITELDNSTIIEVGSGTYTFIIGE